MTDIRGKVKEAVGWLTGDRHVEAAGRAEEEAHRRPTREQVDEASREVRTRYGETRDGAGAPDRLR